MIDSQVFKEPKMVTRGGPLTPVPCEGLGVGVGGGAGQGQAGLCDELWPPP